MPQKIAVQNLKSLRERGERHALLDVREKGEFNLRQIPGSTPVPRGLLDFRVPALVPNAEIPVVLFCKDGRRSTLAASTLEQMGYPYVSVVSGGMDAWISAGYLTWEGTGVPGKEYGEKVSVEEQIPQLTPEELAARLARGEKPVIMDSRTVGEYRKAHLPGAYPVPGGELPAAAVDLVPDEKTTIVVHCAGRTRSILGAHLLSRMALPNPVMGFRNGTMAWQMAGFQLEAGESERETQPLPRAVKEAELFADRMAEEEGLQRLPVDQLRRWQDAGELHYLIDVRLPEEYLEGHIPGALSCPAGQLALQSEDFVAVQDAPIVMACDLQARATFGASLYNRMGFPNVYILEGGIAAWKGAGYPMEEEEPTREVFGLEEARARTIFISPPALKSALEGGEGCTLIDVRGSGDFALGHIPGSVWISRGNLELEMDDGVPDRSSRVVLVCGDGVRSTLASAALRNLGYGKVRVLEGGTRAWQGAGLMLEEGLQGAKASLEEAKGDVPTAMRSGILARTREDMERYLSWEEELGKKYDEHLGSA